MVILIKTKQRIKEVCYRFTADVQLVNLKVNIEKLKCMEMKVRGRADLSITDPKLYLSRHSYYRGCKLGL